MTANYDAPIWSARTMLCTYGDKDDSKERTNGKEIRITNLNVVI